MTTPSWLSGSLRHCIVLCILVTSAYFLLLLSGPYCFSFIKPIFECNVPLVFLIFLKATLVFPILLFSSISLHCSLKYFLISSWYSLELWTQLGIVVVQSPSQVLTLCGPVDCSTPGIPFLHRLPEFAQVHVHCIGDAIKPSHLLMPSSPSALDLSHYQVLFQWVVCAHQMSTLLELQLQHQSF